MCPGPTAAASRPGALELFVDLARRFSLPLLLIPDDSGPCP